MIGFFKRFTHNKEDFRLMIVPSSFSKNYASYKYSANGGKRWKFIYHAVPPSPANEKWKWMPLFIKVVTYSKIVKTKDFDSYQKVLDYEKSQRKIYLDGKKSQRKFFLFKK